MGEHVEAFLDDFCKQLREFPSEKFASHVVALASRLLEPKRTLSELQASCWDEVTFGAPVFDRSEREAAVLGTVTLDELIALFERFLTRNSAVRACLVTAVVPHLDGGDESFVAEAAALGRAACRSESALTIVTDETSFHSRP